MSALIVIDLQVMSRVDQGHIFGSLDDEGDRILGVNHER